MPHPSQRLIAMGGSTTTAMRDQNPYFYFILLASFIFLRGMIVHACTCHCR